MIEKVFLKQAYKNIELEQFFEKKLSRAGFNTLEIVKTPVATKVIIHVSKPGLAIGYSGKNIKFLSSKLEKQFGLKNPHIEVKGIDHPEFDAKYKVDFIVNSLEKGQNWRQVVYRTIRDLANLDLMGFELVLKGKLMGKGARKMKHRVALGYMKKVGDQVSLVKSARSTAYTKAGAIGVDLSLIPPNTMFPDKITREDIEKAAKKLYSKDEPAKEEVKEEEKPQEVEEKKE